jgi:hypothetical protein
VSAPLPFAISWILRRGRRVSTSPRVSHRCLVALVIKLDGQSVI